MAIVGFPQDTETQQLIPAGATEEQRVQIINDLIVRLNGINKQLKDLADSNSSILENNTFKLVNTFTGSLEINAPGGAGTYQLVATVPHGLDYVPTLFAFGNLDIGSAEAFSPIADGAVFIIQSFTSPDNPSLQILGARALWLVQADTVNIYTGAIFADSDVSYNGDFLNYKVWVGRETAA